MIIRLRYAAWMFLLFFAVVLLPRQAISQTPGRLISLQEAQDSAQANNNTVLLAEIDKQIAGSKYRETQAMFLPQLGFSFTTISTNNPLNVFGFKLQQQSVKQADFNPDLLNHPDGAADFATQLELKQPILNLDHIYLRKAAASQEELYGFQSQRTREYLSFEVEKAYLQLQLSYDAVQVLEEALASANAMYQFTENRVTEGLLQKSDALNVRVWITTVETNLAEAKSNIANASDYLGLLMGKQDGTIYQPEQTSADAEGSLLTGRVPANRSDFAALSKAIEASGWMIRSSKKSLLPRINGFASYQLNDNRMFGFRADSYLAGLRLSWNVFQGSSIRHKIHTQTLEREKLVRQLSSHQEESQLELNKTSRQLADAQYRIQQQQSAVENAAEALRILQDRYEQGLVNSTDVLQSQTQLSQQKLALTQAVFSRNVTAAYIKFLTTHID